MYINIYILKIADPPVSSAIFRMLDRRGRCEEVAGRCGNRFDRAAVAGRRGLFLRGLIAPVFHRLALALIAITAALVWRRVPAGKG